MKALLLFILGVSEVVEGEATFGWVFRVVGVWLAWDVGPVGGRPKKQCKEN